MELSPQPAALVAAGPSLRGSQQRAGEAVGQAALLAGVHAAGWEVSHRPLPTMVSVPVRAEPVQREPFPCPLTHVPFLVSAGLALTGG